MKGSPKVIEALNSVLTGELTAINQYFLHARILQDWGMYKLGKIEYEASIDEMKHADQLIQRVLFLEGLPNVQKLNNITVGQNVKEIIDADLKVEMHAIELLKSCIKLSESEGDFASRDLFSSILKSEEEHIDWLETQQSLIKSAGLENYIQSQISMEEQAPE
ncbi:MAG: bacterioferritin [Halobacteriovoraceae bacterium]|nr:bacterioferritin [Halobacteriovoraceae bacterium]MCB9094046.1 bacterioferritin [Halobacteriovoraceae bacterium]